MSHQFHHSADQSSDPVCLFARLIHTVTGPPTIAQRNPHRPLHLSDPSKNRLETRQTVRRVFGVGVSLAFEFGSHCLYVSFGSCCCCIGSVNMTVDDQCGVASLVCPRNCRSGTLCCICHNHCPFCGCCCGLSFIGEFNFCHLAAHRSFLPVSVSFYRSPHRDEYRIHYRRNVSTVVRRISKDFRKLLGRLRLVDSPRARMPAFYRPALRSADSPKFGAES